MQSGRVFRLSSHRYARLKQTVFVSRSPGDEAMPDKSIAATRRLQDIET